MIALDDNIEDHPKFVGLSNDAFALWVRCIGYCRRNLTDGFVPEAVAVARARSKSPQRPIAELLKVSPGCANAIWYRVPGGYQVHDYLEWNPSRAQVEAERAAKRWSRVAYPAVRERDGFACRYCGSQEDLTVDHVLPRSRGGGDEAHNLVVACRSCNSRKGARTPFEAGMVLS